MSCEQIPSVTIYGTTQITSVSAYVTTLTSLIPGNPVVSVLTSVVPAICADDALDCPSETKEDVVTVTPTSTAIYTSDISTNVVVTSIVPQRTLYYACSSSQETSAQGMTSTNQVQETLNNQPSTSTEGDSRVASYTNVQQSSSSISSATLVGQFTGIATQIKGSATVVGVSASSVSSVADTILSPYHTTTSPHSFQPGPSASRLKSVATSLPIVTTSHTSSASSAVASQQEDTNVTPSSSKHAAIAGGIIGGILGSIVIACLVICMKRKKRDKHEDVKRWSGENEDVDYWERRFRALETEGDIIYGEKDDWDLQSSKKLRLTLDLASKDMDIIPSRRFSRLSTVSSFFSSSFGGGIPTRISNKTGLNFSRPIKRADALSIRSYPKSPRSSTSMKSTKTGRHSVSSRKSGKSSQRLSTSVLPSMREEDENTEKNDESMAPREPEEQLIMEWIRYSQVDDDEREQGKRRELPFQRSSWQLSMGGGTLYHREETVAIGPPPPRRSLASTSHDNFVSSPRSTLCPTQSSFDRYDGPYPPVGSSYERSSDLSRTPCLTPAAAKSSESILHLPGSDTSKYDAGVLSDTKPKRSMSRTRRSAGKFVPQLYLTREAITPRLWIDDELTNQFEGSKGSGETERVTEKALISSFSAETIDERQAPDMSSRSSEDSHLEQTISEGEHDRASSPGTYCTKSSLSVVPLSPAPPSLSLSSVTSSLMEDAPEKKIGLAERSAVTPQLPVLTLRSSVASSWTWG